MFNKLILPIVLGVISSTIVNVLTLMWSGLSTQTRWVISILSGVFVFVALAIAFREREVEPASSAGGLAKNINAKGNAKVTGNTYEGAQDENIVLIENGDFGGDFELSNNRVTRNVGGPSATNKG